MHAVSSETESLSDEVPETRRVEHTTRRDDPVLRQTAKLPRDPGHDVTRVAHDYDDGVRTMLDKLWYNALEDSHIFLDEVETSLTFLLTRTSRHDNNFRTLRRKTATIEK